MTIFCPAPFIKAPSGGGGGYSFTLTAGSASGYAGYDTGLFLGALGSISAEPLSGSTLLLFLTAPGDGYIYFSGNVVALLDGLSVWVNGVEYPFDRFDWTYIPGDDATVAEWDTPPTLVNGNDYTVVIQ